MKNLIDLVKRYIFYYQIWLNQEMDVSIEDLLNQTLQVTDNFSKFVEKSGLPYAALLLSAIDFGTVLLDHKSEF